MPQPVDKPKPTIDVCARPGRSLAICGKLSGKVTLHRPILNGDECIVKILNLYIMGPVLT